MSLADQWGLPSWIPNSLAALVVQGNARIIVNQFPLRDTSVHSYRTDPSYINMTQVIGGTQKYRVFNIVVYNTTNQQVTVQAIGNITNDQSFPDVPIGSSFTINSGEMVYSMFPIEQALSPFVSVQVSAATAPSSGYVYAILVID